MDLAAILRGIRGASRGPAALVSQVRTISLIAILSRSLNAHDAEEIGCSLFVR